MTKTRAFARSLHQAIVGNLHLALALHLRAAPVGVAVLGPFDIVLSRYDVVVPDLVYFTNARLQEVVGDTNAQGPPAGRFGRTGLSLEDGDVLKTPLLESFSRPLRSIFELR